MAASDGAAVTKTANSAKTEENAKQRARPTYTGDPFMSYGDEISARALPAYPRRIATCFER